MSNNTGIIMETPVVVEKKKKNMYVNNAEMLEHIKQYKKDCRAAKKAGLPKPKIPDIVGKQLLLIAENLSHKPNFYSYPGRDEMIGDGIENSIQYFDNFDTKKYKNPFAYFTQIIYFAFLRRIQKEKKQLFTKYKYAEHHGVMGDMENNENGEEGGSQQFEIYENLSEFIQKFEDAKKRKKKPKKKKSKLESFMKD
jgi:hypothetical protein